MDKSNALSARILALHREGLTIAAIAKEVGMGQTQVKSRLHRQAWIEKVMLEDKDSTLHLDLPIVVKNRLGRGGIKTITQLRQATEGELLSLDGFGVKMLEIVKDKLREYDAIDRTNTQGFEY